LIPSMGSRKGKMGKFLSSSFSSANYSSSSPSSFSPPPPPSSSSYSYSSASASSSYRSSARFRFMFSPVFFLQIFLCLAAVRQLFVLSKGSTFISSSLRPFLYFWSDLLPMMPPSRIRYSIVVTFTDSNVTNNVCYGCN
jgi:hypothetical protein